MAVVNTHTLREEDLIDDADLDSLIREAITQVIGENAFMHSKMGQWSSNIVEGCLKRLAECGKPFKWEEATDGKLAVQWENATIQISLIVYWLAL